MTGFVRERSRARKWSGGRLPPTRAPSQDSHNDAYCQASLTLQPARSYPPRFASDRSITHGGITTRDRGVSPDRTHTGGRS